MTKGENGNKNDDCIEGSKPKSDAVEFDSEGGDSENACSAANLERLEEISNNVDKKEERAEAAIMENQVVISVGKSKEMGLQTELRNLDLQDKEVQTEESPKKDKDESPPIVMDILHRDLLQQIECLVCFEYMVPPITLCQNGHNICTTCKPSLKHCPTCRGNLTDMKNYCAEVLSGIITHPCKFRRSGCAGQFLLQVKGNHEDECCYRPQKCPFKIVDVCDWEGPMPDMKEHIESIHKDRIEYIGKTRLSEYFEITDGDNWSSVILVQNNIFFSYCKVIDDLLHLCVMHVGTKQDRNKYKYTISIESCDHKQKASFCHVCPNYLEFMNGQFPKEKCAAFYVEFTKFCTSKGNYLPYEEEISKC